MANAPLLSHYFRPEIAPRFRQTQTRTKTQRFAAKVQSKSAVSSSSEARLARDDLLDLISGEERGLRTQRNPSKLSKITNAIDALAKHGRGSVTTSHEALSATWRMLWTTEKEQLFIIEKAPLFGTKAGDVLQVINVADSFLQNVITFPPSGAFVVSSSLEVASPQRINFRFNKAVLRGANWRIPVPPFGQGWFDSIYLDDKVRVAKDIRGDYLVVDKSSSMWVEL